MGQMKESLKLKKWIGSIAWALFLWANNMVAEDYWREIAMQEIAMFPEYFRERINELTPVAHQEMN